MNQEVHFGLVRFGEATAPATGTVYFFHGGNGDDRQLEEAGLLKCVSGDLFDLFARRNFQLALPFVGKSFLGEAHGADAPDSARYFMEEVIQAVEEGSATSDSSRWVGGLSMGGMAALSIFLRNPARFRGVGAHFATLVNFDYFSDAEIQSYAQRNNVPDGYRDLLISDLRAAFPTIGAFARHDPISLAKALNQSALAGKSISFDVGSADEFGLHAGARIFSEVLGKRGIAHRFEEIPGGKHDAGFLVRQFPKLLALLLA